MLTRKAVFDQAWPIILGQCLVPLAGLVDATVIGRTGDASTLAGVALGVTVVNLVFWTFGFLRMGMTGLTAQAEGDNDSVEVSLLVVRGLVAGLMIGSALLLLSPLFVPPLLSAMDVPAASYRSAHDITMLRFWGAPAELGFYAINGWLIGIGHTRLALGCQIAMNAANMLLDLLFVGWLHMGASGVGLGTALSAWIALGAGCFVVTRAQHKRFLTAMRDHRGRLFDRDRVRLLSAVNFNIMIRTIALLGLFSWFSRAGARLGSTTLAANHVLMALVGVSAFVLDGFAFTAEQRVGAAIGAGSRPDLWRAVRLTGEFSIAGGCLFAMLFLIAGTDLIHLVSIDPAVRAEANRMLPFCALVPLIGMPSWLLDGIFIGATRGRALKYAAIASLAAYVETDLALRGIGNDGVWIALLLSYVYRASGLAMGLPSLIRDVPHHRLDVIDG